MIVKLRSCALLALACALAACGGDKSGTNTPAGSNEVLKGSISDDMIAYDTLRSQPPPAKIVTESTGAPGGVANRAAADGEATDAPAQAENASAGGAPNAGQANAAAAPANE